MADPQDDLTRFDHLVIPTAKVFPPDWALDQPSQARGWVPASTVDEFGRRVAG